MITVWGRASSSNVQKVTWTLDELGVEYERIDRGREFGGLDAPEYLANNPNGRVPTIQDGDLILWESQAICRYLARTYNGDHLFPAAPAAAFQVDKWMDWNIAHLAPSMFPMFLAARTADNLEAAKDPKFDKTVSEARRNLSIMQGILGGQDYLAGDSFTLADLVCAVSVSRWLFVGHNFGNEANVEAWYGRVGERPACQRHNVVSF
ncbi:MAG: glutathione S-transferase family protein [Alphaproteobacteria bacterium]|nr:glutathione S-transferase family protein [Alphaproteobacteria bacterium]